MSFDHYHFHMVLRQESMTRAERLEADAQAARIAHAAWRLGRACARALRAVRRAARPDQGRSRATVQPRRNP